MGKSIAQEFQLQTDISLNRSLYVKSWRKWTTIIFDFASRLVIFCPYSVIFWHFLVLEGGVIGPNMPPGLVDTKRNLLPHRKELVAATFVNLIFRNFTWNDDVMSFFLHCVGQVEWAGAEMNGIDTSECHIAKLDQLSSPIFTCLSPWWHLLSFTFNHSYPLH